MMIGEQGPETVTFTAGSSVVYVTGDEGCTLVVPPRPPRGDVTITLSSVELDGAFIRWLRRAIDRGDGPDPEGVLAR